MIAICDTGPLLAYLDRSDPHHDWAVALFRQVRPPLLTSEPVLTEVVYFLREDGLPIDSVFQLIERGALRVDFQMPDHWPRVRPLMSRYPQTGAATLKVAGNPIIRDVPDGGKCPSNYTCALLISILSVMRLKVQEKAAERRAATLGSCLALLRRPYVLAIAAAILPLS